MTAIGPRLSNDDGDTNENRKQGLLTLGPRFATISIFSVRSIAVTFKAYWGKFLFPIGRDESDLTSLSGYDLSSVYFNISYAVDCNLTLQEIIQWNISFGKPLFKGHPHSWYTKFGPGKTST